MYSKADVKKENIGFRNFIYGGKQRCRVESAGKSRQRVSKGGALNILSFEFV